MGNIPLFFTLFSFLLWEYYLPWSCLDISIYCINSRERIWFEPYWWFWRTALGELALNLRSLSKDASCFSGGAGPQQGWWSQQEGHCPVPWEEKCFLFFSCFCLSRGGSSWAEGACIQSLPLTLPLPAPPVSHPMLNLRQSDLHILPCLLLSCSSVCWWYPCQLIPCLLHPSLPVSCEGACCQCWSQEGLGSNSVSATF